MRIEYSKKFLKLYKKVPILVKKRLIERIKLFEKNREAVTLHDHRLKGKWSGLRSINITGDWRAIYTEVEKNRIRFYLIGTHSQLYG